MIINLVSWLAGSLADRWTDRQTDKERYSELTLCVALLLLTYNATLNADPQE